MARDLASLLAAGERDALAGRPGAAVTSLTSALAEARERRRPAEAAAAGWLLGVSLAACGRYGAALDTLEPLAAGPDPGPAGRRHAALAAATVASVHRQLGRHAAARDHDARGLALAGSAGEEDWAAGTAETVPAGGAADAVFDCRLGLAADAVGLGATDTARGELARAARLLPERPERWWRQRVRLDWVRVEVALLQDDAALAARSAGAAVERAERERAPRHMAKGLLFLGVAQAQAGWPEATTTLRRAAALAEELGTLPLVWPARAVLGARLAPVDPADGDRNLAAARSAVRAIAADVPADLRREWLARPDVAALFTASSAA